jgi:NADH-quinone oxidoreductase subunit M
MDFPILSLLVFLPLFGVLFLSLIGGSKETIALNAKRTALFTSLFVFVLSLVMLFNFDANEAGFQFVEKATWIESLGISYHLGVDGISLFFVVLSAFLTPVFIIAILSSIKTRVR